MADAINYKKLEDAVAKGVARGLAQHQIQEERRHLLRREAHINSLYKQDDDQRPVEAEPLVGE